MGAHDGPTRLLEIGRYGAFWGARCPDHFPARFWRFFFSSLSQDDIPFKLRCAICNRLAIDAFRLPCCDQAICGTCELESRDSEYNSRVLTYDGLQARHRCQRLALFATIVRFRQTSASPTKLCVPRSKLFCAQRKRSERRNVPRQPRRAHQPRLQQSR